MKKPISRAEPPDTPDTLGPPGVIDGNSAYTLEEIRMRLGLGKQAWRTARRQGLPVKRVGRRGFVLGNEMLHWLGNFKEQ